MDSTKPNQEQVANQPKRKCLKGGCQLIGVSSYCPDHQKENNAKRKVQRDQRKAESRCYRCGSEKLKDENKSFHGCAKCRLQLRENHKKRQMGHGEDEQSAQAKSVPRGQRKTGATTDPDQKPCHWSGCTATVGPNASMCAVHRLKHAQYQAERRKLRKRERKCSRCSSAVEDLRSSNCAACRLKKAQHSRNKRGKTNTQIQDTQAEYVTCEKDDFIKLVCNPENNEDVEVAEILMQMSKSLLLRGS